MKAIETTGSVNEQHQLLLDKPLSHVDPGRVRIIVLIPEEGEVDENTWLKAAADNSAFAFLKDDVEDIYTLSDGKPFDDQR